MARLAFGPFVLDLGEKRLLRDGVVVDVQPLPYHGKFAQALEAQDEAVRVFERIGLGSRRAHALANRANIKLYLGDVAGAEADIIATRALSPTPDIASVLEIYSAVIEGLRGRFARMVPHCDAALARHGHDLHGTTALLWACLAEARSGRLGEARARLAAAEESAPTGRPAFLQAAFVPVRAALVRAEAAAGVPGATERLVDAEAGLDLSIPVVELYHRVANTAAAPDPGSPRG